MKKNVSDQESDAAIEEWPVRPYSKSELARAYAPEIGERSALNRLSRWIRFNEALYSALKATGYRSTQQIFTSKQVGLIFEYSQLYIEFVPVCSILWEGQIQMTCQVGHLHFFQSSIPHSITSVSEM